MLKICEVRLVKLDIDNFTNHKLLNMDGGPGKFYLDGFAPHEFVKLTKLISTYGGVVMSPDDETIILSKSGSPSEMKHFPLFHVDWLHDSLTRNTLQDIGKYLLPNYPHDSPRMISDSTIKIRDIQKELNLNTSNESDEKSTKILKTQDSQRNRKSEVFSGIMKKESGNCRRSDREERSEEEIKENKKVEEVKKKRSADSKNVSDEIKTKKKIKKEKKSRVDSNNDAKMTLNVSDRDIETISDDSSSDQNSDNAGVGSRDKSAIGIPAYAHLTEERENLGLDNETSFVKKKKRSSEEKVVVKKTSKPYSREENLKIFQYLADNNFLAKANRDFVWDKAAASDIFQDPPRTASGLRQHFRTTLLPNYLEYTSDSYVIAELAKIEKRSLKNIISYFNVEEDEGDTSDSSLPA